MMKVSPKLARATAILSLFITVVVLVAWTYHVFRHPPINKIGYLFTIPFFAGGALNLYCDWQKIRQSTELYIPAENAFIIMMILSWDYEVDSRNFMICSGILTFLIVFIAAMIRVSRELGHPISRQSQSAPVE